jgi:hypothetical protein
MHERSARHPGSIAALGFASLGVVFGDIGTSPLYTLKTVLDLTGGATPAAVLGVLSLIVWTLIAITSIKYVAIAMRVDNDGEGGILALMALLGVKRQTRPGIVALGLFGAALIYGDGAITPAISVLSALEGLTIAAPGLGPYVVPTAVAILIVLFAIQSQGTARIAHTDGQPLAYIYSRGSEAEARRAMMLTKDEARRIAVKVTRLPEPLGPRGDREMPRRPGRCGQWVSVCGSDRQSSRAISSEDCNARAYIRIDAVSTVLVVILLMIVGTCACPVAQDDFYLRGMASVHKWTREGISEALGLFYEAIKLDPEYGSAYGMAAWCYLRRKSDGWMADRVHESAEAARLARRAAQFGQDDAIALSRAGFALAFVVDDVDTGADLVDRAVLLNPNLAAAWYFSSRVRMLLDEPDVAIEHAARAMRLSPLDPLTFLMQYSTALAHFHAGRYGDAGSWAEKAKKSERQFSSRDTPRGSKLRSGREPRESGGTDGASARGRTLTDRFRSRRTEPISSLRHDAFGGTTRFL